VALTLRRRGIERVRPLAGGFHAWQDRGYPVTKLERERSAARGAS